MVNSRKRACPTFKLLGGEDNARTRTHPIKLKTGELEGVLFLTVGVFISIAHPKIRDSNNHELCRFTPCHVLSVYDCLH